jgi:hypothetical protein
MSKATVSERPPTTKQIAEMGQEDKVPCEVYSRIVGYLRPVQNWNKGKKQEFLERKTYRDCVDAAEVEAT